MAKNSIGQFITALRKANGLTQQNVADRLHVSNKAVSRWERDECAPDLSLIPALAEMFGVTCDELLRGERSTPEDLEQTDKSEKRKVKSDKQFQIMLFNQLREFQNRTLISIGLAAMGLLAAMVTDLAFSKGTIAFFLATAMAIISELCQICFYRNARLLPDEEETHTARIDEVNTRIIETTVCVTFLNIALFAFCLPLIVLVNIANYGLTFSSWLGSGLIFSLAAIILSYILYTLFVRRLLLQSGQMPCSPENTARFEKNRKLLKRILAVSGGISLAILAGLFVFDNLGTIDHLAKKEVFTTCESFKSYMEREYDLWAEEGGKSDATPEETLPPDLDPTGTANHFLPETEAPTESQKSYGEILNNSGEVICRYYYNPNLYAAIRFNDAADDKTPITVVTRQSHYDALIQRKHVERFLRMMLLLDFVVACLVYRIKMASAKRP